MSEAYVNFLGGSPLNRLSWLRSSPGFLNVVAGAPSTRWLLFKSGEPLLAGRTLARLSTEHIAPLLGPAPYFGQGERDGEPAVEEAEGGGKSVLEAARLRGTPIVFLGLHEPENAASALPSAEFGAGGADVVGRIEGTPYFAMDVSGAEAGMVEGVLAAGGGGMRWSEPRAAMGGVDAFEAALFAEARSMADWNARNKFCPACGSPVYSLWAGWKLSCSSLLPWADNTGKKPCPSGKGLHNFAHPRTDPVVIMIAINETNDKILLGRNKKFPGNFYSALAGFIEPGESFEDAVKREMWEEAGVTVWDVRYHSGQPWPYPANLMVGFFATADPSKPLRVDLDNELEDARWYTRDEILAVLRHPTGATLSRRDNSQLNAIQEGNAALSHSDPNTRNQDADKTEGEPAFRVPPLVAIAGVLISEWAHGKIRPGGGEALKKGNL